MKILLLLILLLAGCTPTQVHQDVALAEEVLQEGEQLYDQYNNPVVVKKVRTVKPKGFRQLKLQRIEAK